MVIKKRTSKILTKKTSGVKKDVKNAKVEEISLIRRRPSRKTLIFFTVVIIIAIVVYLSRGLFVAATVNGEVIPRWTLNAEMEKQIGERTLNDLITKKLILQEMKNKKVTISDDVVQAEIKKIEDALKKQGRTLDEALLTQGISHKDLNEQLMIQKMIEKLFEKDAVVTDAEVEKYLTDNADVLPEDKDPKLLRTSVKEQLRQQKLTEKFQSWLQELQKKAAISRFVKF